MTINVERESGLVTLEISGILDSTTAPNLEKTINDLSESTKVLILDMAETEHITDAGIGVLTLAWEMMSKKGRMEIVGISESARSIVESSQLGNALCLK